MKTLKTLCLVCLAVLTFSCSKKDDDDNATPKTAKELLISGKWYFESKTPGTYTACEKKGYILFKTNGDLILNSFDDSSGTCKSIGELTATYIITNDENITIVFGTETQSAKINSISEVKLKITNNDNGEVNVFDKTEG